MQSNGPLHQVQGKLCSIILLRKTATSLVKTIVSLLRPNHMSGSVRYGPNIPTWHSARLFEGDFWYILHLVRPTLLTCSVMLDFILALCLYTLKFEAITARYKSIDRFLTFCV
jgi:hypothetical protein